MLLSSQDVQGTQKKPSEPLEGELPLAGKPAPGILPGITPSCCYFLPLLS